MHDDEAAADRRAAKKPGFSEEHDEAVPREIIPNGPTIWVNGIL